MAFLFLGLGSAWAQEEEGRSEVNIFVGGYKTEFLWADRTNNYFTLFDDLKPIHSGDLADLYEPHYYMKSSPVATLCYHYFINRWLRVGAQANLSYLSGSITYRMGNKPEQKFSQTSVSFLPQAKFCLPGSPYFRLYGKVAAGVQVNLGKLLNPSVMEFAWDVVPIGAEWGGKRVYGNAEFCFGSVICGGRVGIGFRF